MAELDLGPPDLREQIQEVEREIVLRRVVCPRWVEAGRLSQAKADRQIAVMEAVAASLIQMHAIRTGLTAVIEKALNPKQPKDTL
jgi:hypothetical protein